MADQVRTALGQWRDSLVNLSGSNRLINYRPTRMSTLEISDPEAALVYRLLSGKDPLALSGSRSEGPIADSDSVEEGTRLLDGAGRRGLPVLSAVKTLTEVQRIAKNLATAANREYLDRGIHVLYLAFGTVTWVDDNGDPRRSPLVLVPVELQGGGSRGPYLLTRSDDDVAVNPALALKFLQREIALPSTAAVEDLLNEGLSAILRVFRTALEPHQMTVFDDCVLATFMFAKEAMYRDLRDNEERILAHPIVRGLGASRQDEDAPQFGFDTVPDERIDDESPPESTPLILDADTSQRAAIAAALQGRSFVLDGPPGTGKSQTIANMIGALLHRGKNVLFVSEKAVALDVVRDRLIHRGLGDYLFELHSHKAVRKEVAHRLGQALDHQPRPPQGIAPSDVDRLREVRVELGAYADALNDQYPDVGWSLFEALGSLAALPQTPALPPRDKPTVPLSSVVWNQVLTAADDLARNWGPAEQGESHVWWGLRSEDHIDYLIDQATARLRDLDSALAPYSAVTSAFRLVEPSAGVSVAALAQMWAERPEQAQDEWLTTTVPSVVEQALAELAQLLDALKSTAAVCLSLAGPRWSSLAARGSSPVPPLGADLRQYLPEHASMAAEGMATLAAGLQRLDSASQKVGSTAARLADVVGHRYPENLSSCHRLVALADDVLSPDRPAPHWIGAQRCEQAKEAAGRLHLAHQQQEQACGRASAFFTSDLLRCDVPALLTRFKGYGPFSFLSADFRRDKATLLSIAAPGVS